MEFSLNEIHNQFAIMVLRAEAVAAVKKVFEPGY
ncbi:hypothetical protein Desgi_3253 [Desulfoscipio gibsoniae DSM 7213]|uniref:Uncharacterized protein n=1 Tax=Desulfoscipio gibsoniae DSM 7213 TaxID=767817 RepID=R4KPV4_9FIRM|nr:hypothetical protein Desgi_3253 [Desulfoscipio gibsoniae DSM 7213]